MSTPADSIESILSWDINKLWNAFLIVCEESDNYTKEMELVKEGVTLKYHISYLINEWYELMPEYQKVLIKGHWKTSIRDFEEDKNARERIMREILIEEYEEGGITEARTKK